MLQRWAVVVLIAIVMARLAWSSCGNGCNYSDEWVTFGGTNGFAYEPYEICKTAYDCANPYGVSEECDPVEWYSTREHTAQGCAKDCPLCYTSLFYQATCSTWSQYSEDVVLRICWPIEMDP